MKNNDSQRTGGESDFSRMARPGRTPVRRTAASARVSESEKVSKPPVAMNVPRARRLMAALDIDLLLAFSPRNVGYLTGFYSQNWFWDGIQHFMSQNLWREEAFPLAGFCLDESKPPFLSVNPWVTEFSLCWVDEVKQGGQAPIRGSGYSYPQVETAIECIQERGLERGRIGYEPDRLPARYFDEFRKALPQARFVDAQELFLEIRAVKTDVEIVRLKEGYRIATAVYRDLFQFIRPGLRLEELVQRERMIADRLGGLHYFDHVWISGPQEPWRPGPDKTVRIGDAGGLDLGVYYEGYGTDFARAVSIGPARDDLKRAMDDLMLVREVIRKTAAPGSCGAEILRAAQDCVRRHNMKDGAGCLGHGLGLSCHEIPFLTLRDTLPLEPGMVFVIEMGRIIPATNTYILIEDAGLITPTGWENVFTDLPPDLVEIE